MSRRANTGERNQKAVGVEVLLKTKDIRAADHSWRFFGKTNGVEDVLCGAKNALTGVVVDCPSGSVVVAVVMAPSWGRDDV
jgi:hypothetical protein